MRNLRSLSIILITILLYISESVASDSLYKDTLSAVNKREWSRAEHLAKKTGSRALYKIVLAHKYADSSCKYNKFEDIVKFLEENPGWANEKGIKAQGEYLINGSTDQEVILSWFSKNKPITANGHKFYAYASANLIKDPHKLAPIIKTGWHYGNFSPDEQTRYYKKFKQYITQEDHIKKVDNHLVNNQILSAKNAMSFVDAEYKKSFQAQMDIIKNPANASSIMQKVDMRYITPGLAYYYLDAVKKQEPKIDNVVKLLAMAKKHNALGDKFYNIQSYISRECIEKKRYGDAYRVISHHFASSPNEASSAEFLAGWLALRFLHKADLAKHHFIKFNNLVKSPISKSRGLYWLARTYTELGEKEHATHLYEKASKDYPFTFYGQASTIELGHGNISLPNITLASYGDNKVISNSDLFNATLIVAKYGTRGMAQCYLTASGNKYKDPKKILALAHSINNLNNTHYNVWFAKVASQNNVFIKHMNFPRPYKLPELPVEEALTYSIIRQESVFDHSAVSSANAKGLMQLLDETACLTAKKISMHCNKASLTRDPKYNIILGSNYLGKVINDFDGSYILAIASYNAGPNKIKKWLGIYGDPRKMRNYYDVIDWIEIIPYHETRNYVHRVLENLQIYRSVIKNSTKLHLKHDLIHRRA